MNDPTCPDCGKPLMEAADFESDEVSDGACMFCEGCGFQIAGRDERQIKSALIVLQRWEREEAAHG